MNALTHSRLLELLSYDQATGLFTWRVRVAQRIHVGDVAGSVRKDGYVDICIDGRHYLGHRLAWFYVRSEWPCLDLDHRDTVRSHNAISNLREATNAQNQANQRCHSDNAFGFKGVSFHKHSGHWQARIGHGDRTFYLGSFTLPELAHAAYVSAAKKHFGEFARAG